MGYSGTEVGLFIIGQIVVAAAVWGGIRSDLRGMHRRIDDVKDSADKAHQRLDDYMGMDQTGNHHAYRKSSRPRNEP